MKEYLINFQKNECAINGSCWMLKNKTKTKTGQRVFPTQISFAHSYLQYQHTTVWIQIRNLKRSAFMSTHVYKHTLRNMMGLTIFVSETGWNWLQKTPSSIIAKPPKNENRVLCFSMFKKGSLKSDV